MYGKSVGLFIGALALLLTGCPTLPDDESLDYASDNIGILKYVPPGTFQRDDTATNTSTVSAFRMSRHEITRLQFYLMMEKDETDPAYSSGIGDPVERVNWYHCIAFCNKLSMAEGLTPVYSVSGIDFASLHYNDIPITSNATWDAAAADWDASGYRIPTEMEWQWAAMGAQDAREKAFAGSTGSNSIGDYAWYASNSGTISHPAGTKLPNEIGLFDMSGNVHELCWDWYDANYPTGAVTDYRGAASGTTRVLRGGCMYTTEPECSVATRRMKSPHDQDDLVGFRVVRP